MKIASLFTKIVVIALTVAGIISCEKEEGIGGNSSISGNVYKTEYFKNYPQPVDTIPAAEQEVYIVYGNNDYYNDRVRTHYDGFFRFDYLREGNYTVYVYSPGDPENIAVVQQATITKKKQNIHVENIFIKDKTEGTSTITGKVKAIDYYDVNLNPKGPPYNVFYAQDEDVYIIYENTDVYFDKFSTNYDATYQFSNLIEGTYYLYVYSRDHTSEAGVSAVIDTVVITRPYEAIVLNDIIIYK